jgi:hypothetical protein
MMKDEAFLDRLREGFNDIFLTLGMVGMVTPYSARGRREAKAGRAVGDPDTRLPLGGGHWWVSQSLDPPYTDTPRNRSFSACVTSALKWLSQAAR